MGWASEILVRWCRLMVSGNFFIQLQRHEFLVCLLLSECKKIQLDRRQNYFGKVTATVRKIVWNYGGFWGQNHPLQFFLVSILLMQYKKEPCYSLFAMVVIGTMILGFDYVAPVKKICTICVYCHQLFSLCFLYFSTFNLSRSHVWVHHVMNNVKFTFAVWTWNC